MKHLGLFTLMVSLCACGGDDGGSEDLAGIYAVSSSTTNTSCDAEGAADPEAPSHIRLRKESLLGQELLVYGDCTGPTDADCTDAGLFSSFVRQGGEWVYQLSASSGGGTLECSLTYSAGVIEDLGDGSIRIEFRTYGESDATLSEAQCSPDEAEMRGESMPCEGYDVVAANKVTAP